MDADDRSGGSNNGAPAIIRDWIEVWMSGVTMMPRSDPAD